MLFKPLQIITRLANGGAEETMFDLVIQLAKRGVYCDIAIGREQAPEVLNKFSIPDKCKIYTISHLVKQAKPLYELKALKELRALIKKNDYNIVQTHGSKAGILGRIAAHKEHVPIIIGMIHGISFSPAHGTLQSLLFKNLERYTAKFSHSLVCVGEDLKHTYIAANIGKEEQYSVIYTGMNLDRFSQVHSMSTQERQSSRRVFQLPGDLNTVIIGCIGRLEGGKNQQELLEIFAELVSQVQNIHLCFIGDGPNQSLLVSLAERRGVSDKVSFLGYVSDIWKIMPALDIHCMVSLREGLPRVLVQISAAGIPNVCYKVDGAWEIIEHEISGYIVSQGNREDYINSMVQLIQKKNMRAEFGVQATRKADERWSLEKFGDSVIHLYHTLLSEDAIKLS